MNKNDLTGQRFGRLVVLRDSGKRSPSNNIYWLCQCDCGKTKATLGQRLRSGKTSSCGCYLRECRIKHGDTKRGKIERIYTIWTNMKGRCYRVNKPDYKYYGGRGITVCEEWRNDYAVFRFWAMLNGYQDNLTIDRIDSAGNYEPHNCQWITKSENVGKANQERYKNKSN